MSLVPRFNPPQGEVYLPLPLRQGALEPDMCQANDGCGLFGLFFLHFLFDLVSESVWGAFWPQFSSFWTSFVLTFFKSDFVLFFIDLFNDFGTSLGMTFQYVFNLFGFGRFCENVALIYAKQRFLRFGHFTFYQLLGICWFLFRHRFVLWILD